MAKRDQNGYLVSNPEALKELYVNTYKDQLQHRDDKLNHLTYEYLQKLKYEI